MPAPPVRMVRHYFGAEPGPARRMVVQSLLANTGFGVYIALVPIYLVRVAHLEVVEVGAAATMAGLAQLLLTPYAGRLADRIQPRYVAAGSGVLFGAAMAAFTLVHSVAGVLAVSVVAGASAGSAANARRAITAHLAGADAAAFRARVLSASALGQVVSAGILAGALSLDTLFAYDVALTSMAALTAVAGTFVLSIGDVEIGGSKHAAGQGSPTRTWEVLRDRPYLAVIAICAVFQLVYAVQEIGLPLWMLTHTDLAKPWRAAYLTGNLLGIALLQIHVGRRITTPRHAGRALAAAGVLLGVDCAAAAWMGHAHGWGTVTILALVTASEVAAQLLYYGAENELTMSLAPADKRGEYLGLLMSGEGAAVTVGPVVCTAVVGTFFDAGWLALGTVFVAAGLLALPVSMAGANRQQPAPSADALRAFPAPAALPGK